MRFFTIIATVLAVQTVHLEANAEAQSMARLQEYEQALEMYETEMAQLEQEGVDLKQKLEDLKKFGKELKEMFSKEFKMVKKGDLQGALKSLKKKIGLAELEGADDSDDSGLESDE